MSEVAKIYGEKNILDMTDTELVEGIRLIEEELKGDELPIDDIKRDFVLNAMLKEREYRQSLSEVRLSARLKDKDVRHSDICTVRLDSIGVDGVELSWKDVYTYPVSSHSDGVVINFRAVSFNYEDGKEVPKWKEILADPKSIQFNAFIGRKGRNGGYVELEYEVVSAEIEVKDFNGMGGYVKDILAKEQDGQK